MSRTLIGWSTAVFRRAAAPSRPFVHRPSKVLVVSPEALPIERSTHATHIWPRWDRAATSSAARSFVRTPVFQRKEECANRTFPLHLHRRCNRRALDLHPHQSDLEGKKHSGRRLRCSVGDQRYS